MKTDARYRKACTKCQEFRPLSEFYRNKKSPDGLQYWCKRCIRSYLVDYHRRKRTLRKKREYNRLYYLGNADKILEQQRTYRLKRKGR